MAPYDSCIYPLWRGALAAYKALPLADWALVGLVLILIGLALGRWPARWYHARRAAGWSALVLAVVAGGWHAISRSWVSSEALVTIRYADQLIAGSGLTFNAGERVAGYSSLLGVLTATPLRALGLSVQHVVTSVGIAGLAMTQVATHLVARRQSADGATSAFSLSPFLLATSATFVGFASGDVDVMLGTGLLLLALERSELNRSAVAGGLAGLAALCGSDYWLLGLGLASAHLGLGPVVRTFRFLGGWALAVVPAQAFSWWYFGDPIPERFHAWSGLSWYGGQGTVYVLWSAFDSGLFLLLPALMLGHFARRARLLGRFLVVAAALHLVYVLVLGGDYLVGRLMTPLVPIAVLVAEAGLRFAWTQRAFTPHGLALRVATVAAALLVAGLGIRHPMLKAGEVRCRLERPPHSGSDEASDALDAWRALAASLERVHPPPRLALADAERAQTTSLPVLLTSGATNRVVSRRPLEARGRVGQEKGATADVLFAAGMDLSDASAFPAPYAAFSLVQIGSFPLHLVRYRAEVVSALAPHATLPIRSPESLIAELGRPPDEATRQCHLWFTERFLLDPATPAERKQLVDRLGLPTPIATWLAAPEGTLPQGWQLVAALELTQDTLDPWLQDGTAFERWPVRLAAVRQGRTLPHDPFLNSCSETKGDRSQGILQSPPFTLQGELMSLEVAGGKDPARLRVELLVDDRVVTHAATGCNSEVFHRVLWDIRAQHGKRARLLVTDDSKDGWGHIMVANVHQFGVTR